MVAENVKVVRVLTTKSNLYCIRLASLGLAFKAEEAASRTTDTCRDLVCVPVLRSKYLFIHPV
jgi:hypothetical protein